MRLIPRHLLVVTLCTCLTCFACCVELNLPECRSSGACSNEICSYTLNFTAAIGNASESELMSAYDSGSGNLESCSLYQRLPVCINKGQAFKPEFLPNTFRTSSGANCSVQDIKLVQQLEDKHVMYARGSFVPPCLLPGSGCDCKTLDDVNWGTHQMAPIANADGSVRKFPARVSCKRDGNKYAFAVFVLSCPLEVGEWVAADIALARTYTPSFCSPSNLNDGVWGVFLCLLMLACLLVIGFVLLLVQHAAQRTVHMSIEDTSARRWAMKVSSVLGTLFDINGVLHMDMAEGRDRFFTVNVMTSVVLTIGTIVFAPRLKADEEVAFGMPNAQLSNLDLKRIMELMSRNPHVRMFLRSLMIPLMTLGISACLGLLAYLILLVNYTYPPPWTRRGDVSGLVANEMVHKGWRAKYIGKKMASIFGLLLLDFVALTVVGQWLVQQPRIQYPIPYQWLNNVLLIFLFSTHLKYIEVVFVELTDGGMFSGCCFCFRCCKSVKARYQHIPFSQTAIPVAQPVFSNNPEVELQKGTQSMNSDVSPEALSDQTVHAKADDTVEPAGPKSLTRVESENTSTSIMRNFSLDTMRARMKTVWVDARNQRFKYSGWFLAAVTISVVLAVFFWAVNMDKVLVLSSCLDLQAACMASSDSQWVPMILAGISAILNRNSDESVLTKLVSTYLASRVDTALGNMNQDVYSALKTNGSTGTAAQEVYNIIQSCNPEQIADMVDTISTVITAEAVANSNVTAVQAVAALGFDVTSVVKPIIESQLQPSIMLACPALSQASLNVSQVEAAVYKRIDAMDNFLQRFQRSFFLGGMIGCSIGLVVALISLLVIMQVYQSALLRLQKEHALKGIVQNKAMDTEEKEEAVQMFMLTEEARETMPLRAVFFYGVIFSSVLLQMQIVSGVFTGLIMLLLMPTFWSTIAIQVAAYMVTIILGIAISVLVVGTLGHHLAPNGRITSPSGWLVYYIIFSCAYIVMGIFIAVSRLVFVLLTSLVYIVRIDKCINLIGKQLDPAYTSFLGMIRMHTELPASAARNKRYTGNWGRVRRVVFERKHLLKQELERRATEQGGIADI